MPVAGIGFQNDILFSNIPINNFELINSGKNGI
jgi:hypothetical protein